MDGLLSAKRCQWLVVGILVASSIGCGGSENAGDSSATIAPGTESSIETTGGKINSPESPSLEAPGGMQLPANATIDMPTGKIQEPKSGGFTLPSDESSDTQTSRKPPIDAASQVIDVQFAGWDVIAEKAKSASKITVIDLWSLSCEPCMKEFPGLVRLHDQHGDKVQCIAANVDFDGRKSRPPEHYQDAVATFLASVDAGSLPAYICTTPSDEVFEATDIISIPSVLIYDADGKQIHKFVDAGDTIGFTYEKDLAPLIEKLVQ